MSRIILVGVASLFAFLVTTPAMAVAPDSTDAKAIMDGVFDRETGDRVSSKMVMKIKDKSGRERERALNVRSMNFPEGSKSLMRFSAPADVKNTGLLSVDYDDGAKNDDQWLYLPSLRKSTRIASTQKSGSFMGTDFSYADMTKADPKDYDYKILKQSAQVNGVDCWKIEARPKTEKAARETGYLKTNIWVDKSRLIVLQTKAWVKAGKRLKYLLFEDIKKIDDVWVIHTLRAQTRKGKSVESETVMTYSDLKLNDPSVAEKDFSQREMEK
ncbi:MAG: outer membrane lipoprotein-sorting protein [Deltaproteobacteria bacterium]|jgi:outer membrane lipoprotein-sorting protein|nr:outer membrane lipoprotein-sorting protein [Deltaproteobacteria bacterium]MBT6434266.1 outer membrane lipoprotein-sorting protein [Deltaproteobacteria bacterium]MBT6489160.1 outer membrane lipoprotein-sorting protein [Deltaproteobacteria bacterium]